MKKLTKCLRKDTGIVFFYFFLFIIKISYYNKNKEVLLEKAYDKYHNLGGKERVNNIIKQIKKKLRKKKDYNIGSCLKMRNKL